jgi:hypothetical protein
MTKSKAAKSKSSKPSNEKKVSNSSKVEKKSNKRKPRTFSTTLRCYEKGCNIQSSRTKHIVQEVLNGPINAAIDAIKQAPKGESIEGLLTGPQYEVLLAARNFGQARIQRDYIKEYLKQLGKYEVAKRDQYIAKRKKAKFRYEEKCKRQFQIEPQSFNDSELFLETFGGFTGYSAKIKNPKTNKMVLTVLVEPLDLSLSDPVGYYLEHDEKTGEVTGKTPWSEHKCARHTLSKFKCGINDTSYRYFASAAECLMRQMMASGLHGCYSSDDTMLQVEHIFKQTEGWETRLPFGRFLNTFDCTRRFLATKGRYLAAHASYEVLAAAYSEKKAKFRVSERERRTKFNAKNKSRSDADKKVFVPHEFKAKAPKAPSRREFPYEGVYTHKKYSFASYIRDNFQYVTQRISRNNKSDQAEFPMAGRDWTLEERKSFMSSSMTSTFKQFITDAVVEFISRVTACIRQADGVDPNSVIKSSTALSTIRQFFTSFGYSHTETSDFMELICAITSSTLRLSKKSKAAGTAARASSAAGSNSATTQEEDSSDDTDDLDE